MRQYYEDILLRIAEEPAWFDEYAVPRYCEFAPTKLANMYSRETALAEVTCQVCKRVFRVALSKCNWPSGTIADAIRSRILHYSDPPNVCCCGNMHMNSEPRRIVEYWRCERQGEWTRDYSLEVDIRPDWVLLNDRGWLRRHSAVGPKPKATTDAAMSALWGEPDTAGAVLDRRS